MGHSTLYIAYRLSTKILLCHISKLLDTQADPDTDVTLVASMLKLKVGRLAREITDSCLQFWGGMGFTEEVLVSRLYR